MINEIYAIYDEASECYIHFMPCLNEKIAKMTFEKMFKEKRFNIPLLYDYPSSFRVYKLADFDDNSGVFSSLSQPKLLVDFGSLSVITA